LAAAFFWVLARPPFRPIAAAAAVMSTSTWSSVIEFGQ
jgi:hypothetical protein